MTDRRNAQSFSIRWSDGSVWTGVGPEVQPAEGARVVEICEHRVYRMPEGQSWREIGDLGWEAVEGGEEG